MAIVYTEAIATKLSQAVLTPGQTSISVTSTAQMPALSGGDWIYLTLYNNDTGEYEVVRVTAITGNVLTVVRDLGGTNTTFGVNETTVVRWVINLDWEDLRTELQAYAATPQDLADSIAGFLTEAQIQALIDAALVPYITTADVNTAIANFLTQTEIQTLIDNSLANYQTAAEATTTATNVVDSEVTSRNLVDDTEAQTIVDDAIAASGFLDAVNITDDGETVGILAGDGTSGDPLKVDWGASNPDNVPDIPANTTHSNLTSGNPHQVTALQARCLTIDTPSGDQIGFTPTDDYHPANKKYVDDELALVANTPTLDLTDVGSDTGRVVIAEDTGTSTKKFLRCWQKATLTRLGGTGGQGDYTISFPTDNQLDAAPTDLKAIADVNAFTAGERLSAAMSLYVVSTTTTQAVIAMDVGKDGTGVPSGKDMVIRIGYTGWKTIL